MKNNLPHKFWSEVHRVLSFYRGWFFVRREESGSLRAFLESQLKDKFVIVSAPFKTPENFNELLKSEPRCLVVIPDTKKLLSNSQFQKFINHLCIPAFHHRIPVYFIVDNPDSFHQSIREEKEQLISGNHFKDFSTVLYISALNHFQMCCKLREVIPENYNDIHLRLNWMPATLNVKGIHYSSIEKDSDGKLSYSSPGKLPILPDWQIVAEEEGINYYRFASLTDSALHNSKNALQIIDELDEHQKKALEKLWGPQLVAAPAGSGKTKTLIARIAHMVYEFHIPPDRILALAFNRKAMEEMRNRLAGIGIKNVSVYTLHAFGYRLLKKYYPDWKFSATEGDYQLKKLLKESVQRHFHLPAGLDDDLLNQLEEAHRLVKSNLVPPEDIRFTLDDKKFSLRSIFESLTELQKRLKIFFFEDMIYKVLHLLLERPKLLENLQKRFPFILVDEYQDLNPAQIAMVSLLGAPGNNIMAVGDDDQLIYDWRGANPDYFLRFHDYFGEGSLIVLNRNYRSPLNLVYLASNLIRHNKARIPKQMEADKLNEMALIRLFPAEDFPDELKTVGRLIREYQQYDIPLNQIRILTRYHSFALVLAVYLMKSGIPFFLLDTDAIFKLQEVKDFKAYLNVILFPEQCDVADVRRILYRPTRYLNARKVSSVQKVDDLWHLDLGNVPFWRLERWQNFLTRLRGLMHLAKQPVSPTSIIDGIYFDLGVSRLYEDENAPLNPEQFTGRSFWLSMRELATQYEDIHSFYRNFDKVFQQYGHQKGVQISTIHKTKGNEFNHVILFHMNDPESNEIDDIESERRVFYVGITRMIESLSLTFIKKEPHQFIGNLFSQEWKKKKSLEQILREIRKEIKGIKNLIPRNSDNSAIFSALDNINSAVSVEMIYPDLINVLPPHLKKHAALKLIQIWEQFLMHQIQK